MTILDLPEQLELRQGAVSLRLLITRDAAGLAAAAEENGGREGEIPVPRGLAAACRATTAAYHQLRSAKSCTFAIRWHERIVGTTSYTDLVARPDSGLRRGGPLALEIGPGWLARSAQRPEVATAVAFLLLQHAFETWQVQRVRMRCAARDGNAAKDIAALGLRCDGLLRSDATAVDGMLRDALVYSLLAEEWSEVRSALRSRLELHQPVG